MRRFRHLEDLQEWNPERTQSASGKKRLVLFEHRIMGAGTVAPGHQWIVFVDSEEDLTGRTQVKNHMEGPWSLVGSLGTGA